MNIQTIVTAHTNTGILNREGALEKLLQGLSFSSESALEATAKAKVDTAEEDGGEEVKEEVEAWCRGTKGTNVNIDDVEKQKRNQQIQQQQQQQQNTTTTCSSNTNILSKIFVSSLLPSKYILSTVHLPCIALIILFTIRLCSVSKFGGNPANLNYGFKELKGMDDSHGSNDISNSSENIAFARDTWLINTIGHVVQGFLLSLLTYPITKGFLARIQCSCGTSESTVAVAVTSTKLSPLHSSRCCDNENEVGIRIIREEQQHLHNNSNPKAGIEGGEKVNEREMTMIIRNRRDELLLFFMRKPNVYILLFSHFLLACMTAYPTYSLIKRVIKLGGFHSTFIRSSHFNNVTEYLLGYISGNGAGILMNALVRKYMLSSLVLILSLGSCNDKAMSEAGQIKIIERNSEHGLQEDICDKNEFKESTAEADGYNYSLSSSLFQNIWEGTSPPRYPNTLFVRITTIATHILFFGFVSSTVFLVVSMVVLWNI